MFRDRAEAGQKLALKLKQYANNPSVLVLGLPRGGVPVAAEVAKALDAPLDVFVVRKLGLPGFEGVTFGAVASGGLQGLDSSVVAELGIPDEALEAVRERQLRELHRQEQAYRGNEPAANVIGRTVILVDDGVATGSSMRAAIEALRPRRPARIIVAVPVAPLDWLREFAFEADEVVCLNSPEHFAAVGEWYLDFRPITDEDISSLLATADWRTSVHAT